MVGRYDEGRYAGCGQDKQWLVGTMKADWLGVRCVTVCVHTSGVVGLREGDIKTRRWHRTNTRHSRKYP